MPYLTFEITGMHCTSCGLLIDNTVEDVPGVTSSTTDLRTALTVVEGTATPAAILTAIDTTGYKARHLLT